MSTHGSVPEEISFIDETSKDEQTNSRRYARSRKGRRAQKDLPFVRRRRVSTEALLTLDGMVARTTVEGSMTSETFMAWLKFTVVCLVLQFSSPSFLTSSSPQLPKCSAYPGPLIRKMSTLQVLWTSLASLERHKYAKDAKTSLL